MATQIRGTQIISATVPASALIQTDITQVGTLTSGVWHATEIAVAYGGTGATNAADARTNLGLALGSDVQAYSSNLANFALASEIPILYGGTGSSNASGARSALGLAIGSDVQAYNATLASVAGGTYSGDDSIVTVGTISAGVWNGTKLGASYVPNLESLTVGGNVSLGAFKIQSSATPTVGSDLVTKTYVDALSTGARIKAACRVASTANLTLSGTQTIDGVSVIAGDRVLVKNQTSGADNGIYVVAAGAWARSTDADVSNEVQPGMLCFISEGSVNGNQQFVLVTDAPITLGTTALVFSQFTGPTSLTVGDGLSNLSNQLNLVLDGVSLSKSGSGLKVAALGISSSELAADSVITAKIANLNVTTDKLADEAVTSAKIAAAAFSSGIKGGDGDPIMVQMSIETPAGSVNGSNTAFTLAHVPGAGMTQVFLNGLQQVVSVDYTLASDVITFNVAPVSGDSVRAVYFY